MSATDFRSSVRVMDLRSDTVTKPTPEMREAMKQAEVGDDVYREDPTVIRLEKLVASMLGKEAALFFPSGTMANLSAIMAHCWERGREVLVGDKAHIYLYEQGGASQLAGVRLRSLQTKEDGTLDLEEISEKIEVEPNIHCCVTGLICLENTHNRCGGLVLPTEYVNSVCRLAKAKGVPVHMDGARLANAAVHLGSSLATLVKECDSVSMCLSKGLGAPVGSVVAGSARFVERLLRCRKVLGGAMRQVGVLAAAGLVALQSFEKRLALDHKHAQDFAKTVIEANCPLVTADLARTHTNMVILRFSGGLTAHVFAQRMEQVSEKEASDLGFSAAVKVHVWSSSQVRCVFHSDVPEEDARMVVKKMQYVVSELTARTASV